MSMFGVSQSERADALYGVLSSTADTSALEREQAPGFLAGDLAGAAGSGIYRGISRGASVLGNVATPVLRPIAKSIDEVFGSSADEWLRSEQDKANQALVDSKIDPKTTGMAGQLLHGLGDVLTTVVSTGGNPLAAGGLYGLTQAELGISEGLDTTTAVLKGGLEGLGLGVGVWAAPAFGSTLFKKMMSGGLINTGIGVGTRAPVSGLLNARGYPEMAKQYEVFDSTAIITDAVLGAAFGSFYRKPGSAKADKPAVPPGAVPPSVVDAALTANLTHNAEITTAPGIPINTRTREQHAAALDTAITDLAMGRSVSVEAILADAGFTGKRPDFDALKIISEELEKAGFTDVVTKLRAIEAEAKARHLHVDPDEFGSVVRSDAAVETTVAGTGIRDSAVRIGEDTVPTRLMLVEAGDVAATMGKAENQFRDRSRMASDQQIADIAARLDARLLMDSPVMDVGAPVLSSDGVVIGGNGRAAAIGRAYDGGTAAGYLDALRAEFGAAVDGMQRPMLVRVLQRDVDIQKAAILSNEGQALRMSALEQAKVDAERLGDFRAFEFSEDGAVDLAANMPFIRAWAAEMPPGQRAAIMDADGKLSAEGAGRLRNAILFKAYGDSPTLARLVEATDPGSRNIAAALTRVAPAVADAREAIARGDLYPVGLHDDLIQAVEKIDNLRRIGMGVADWSNQIDAFGDGMTAEARLLVQFLDGNIRAARQISDGIFGFYNRLLELGNPRQGSMFEAAQPDKMRMLTLALEAEAPMYSKAGPSALTKFLSDITSTDEAFRFPASKATDLEAAVREIDPGFKLQPILNKDDARPKSKGYVVFAPDGGKGFIYLFDDGGIQVNFSKLNAGKSGGSKLYAALSDFAFNTGKRFEGDSAGISLAAIIRRTENMLSGMLKHRGSDHLVPHAAQVDPGKHPNPGVRKALRELGFTGVKWSTGDFNHNVAQIATQTYNVVRSLVGKELDDVTVTEYGDFQRISDGELLTDADFSRLAKQAEERLGAISKDASAGDPPGIGGATIKRAALVNTVLRKQGSEGGTDLLAALGGQLRVGGLGGARGLFHSRGKSAGSTVGDLTTAFRAQFGRDADRLLEAGRVRLVQSVKDLPGSGHPDDVGGMFWQGESYVVADNTSLSQMRGRVLHEVGEHAGMEQMLGAGLYQQVLDAVALKAKTDPVFADALGLAKERANKPEHVPAETLAYLIENAPELGVVRRVLAAVRQWVYRTTGGRFVDLTQADLQMMAVASLRRYARAGEAAAGGADAPRYMTFFQGTPSVFKPEEGAPLGRLRWRFMNSGEGAQAFGYGHYLAQQEWIARVRYRDRLVKRDQSKASMEIDGPEGKITITGKDEPAYKIGDRLVHVKMGSSADGVSARIIEQLRNGSTVDEIRKWAIEDGERLKKDLAAAERGFTVAEVSDGKSTWFTVLGPDGDDMYLKGAAKKMTRAELDDATKDYNEGFRRKGIGRPETILRMKQDIAKGELVDTLLPELTTEVTPKVEENATFGGFTVFDGTGRRTDQRFAHRADAEKLAASLPPGRVLRRDIEDVRPEPPKGALYGKHIPDEEFEKFMVWNAPMADQPPRVQEVFAKFGVQMTEPLSWFGPDPDGSIVGRSKAGILIRITPLTNQHGVSYFSLSMDGKPGPAFLTIDLAKKEAMRIGGSYDLDGKSAYESLAEQVWQGDDRIEAAWYAAEQEIMVRRGFDDLDVFMEWRENVDMNKYSEEVASVILWQHGIPGHKFLDGESKSKTTWDSDDAKFNLVLYSDDLGKVAWESRNNDNEWVSANGRAVIRKEIDTDTADVLYVAEVDGQSLGAELTIEEAMRGVEKNLDSFYSRTGDKMKPPDPIEDTTMPGARMFADQAEAEVAQAQELSSGMLPAVECFLQVGQ